MLTVGETLKKTRTSKKIPLEMVEKSTRIRLKYLQALEENKFHLLPSTAYIKGFIKNYSEFLSLDPKQMLMLYRREFDERKNIHVFPTAVETPIHNSRFRITPNTLLSLSVLTGFLIFLIYLFIQYRTFTLPPPLTVSNPKDSSTINSDQIEIVGKTNSDVKILINDQSVTVASDGTFNQKIELQKGLNKIVITAVNKRNQKTNIIRSVNSEIP